MMTFADQFHHHASLLSPSLLVFFSVSILWEHICILNARFGGKIDQQNVIMHKAYSKHLPRIKEPPRKRDIIYPEDDKVGNAWFLRQITIFNLNS